MKLIKADYVIVGSGPGGASIARELSALGKDVVIVEKGMRHKISKSKLRSYRMYDKWAVFSRSKEGVIIDRAITLGGCSVVFSGNSFDPPARLSEEIGIDLSDAADEIKREIGIKPFSPAFSDSWTGIRRMRSAAADLGVNLKPQEKFINEEKCRNVCDGCMTGCRNRAKWTAREWIDEAVANGARLVTQADVKEVLFVGNTARGILASTPSGDLAVKSNHVVLSAGGIGTAVILQQSGIETAGKKFFMDPMNVVWGFTDAPIVEKSEMTFSFAADDMADEKGFILGNVSGKGAWVAQLVRPGTGWKALGKYGKWDRMIGMFTKVADDAVGRVSADGKMSKPLTEADRRKTHEATALAKQILIGAGVNPRSILVSENIGGHPGGTAAAGEVVDSCFQVKGRKNLFVCDASVFPRSPGRPPTLTILALGRHIARNVLI